MFWKYWRSRPLDRFAFFSPRLLRLALLLRTLRLIVLRAIILPVSAGGIYEKKRT
jgi:hypothetical protein